MSDKIYTVSQLNKYIKQRFEDDIILNSVMIRGEISNFKVHTSGHCYFTLKDTSASIKCVAFRSFAMRLRFAPQNGMKVIAKGYVSIYERDGAYQLYVQGLVPEGIGELSLALEQLKEKLSKEGLFDSKYKKPLPFYPKKIGVVTSRTGAVIRDICHVAKRRNPLVKIVLYSVLVQGEEASTQICEGINFFNEKYPVDVLIVGRGGGSMEDLWAFNEEKVVRAIFNSKIPVISAVGHETDYSLSDLVSDVRAATPSQAAELAVPERDGLINYIDTLQKELNYKYYKQIESKKSQIQMLLQNSLLMHKDKLLISKQQQMDLLIERLYKSAQISFKDKLHQATLLNEKLQTLNPINILKRGYSLTKKQNKFIKSVKDVQQNDFLQIVLADGTIKVKVIDIDKQDK
ncbi:exodeoxyribonuclease VII large subunit [Megamonas hypermegale]|uniref:exodeoxyribonuclease VII large subunit n=1 Tax=Megamonas hypermegale TaxID=158847 RepID=UPI00195DF980|nr:exodeoxyribonuclease VII large subunit [Megamonas hypermegale]MBM6760827.1 exodeoxyribonuclease VII large subunit [Megamonas hypermegale]